MDLFSLESLVPKPYLRTLTGISIFCLADRKSPWVTRIFGQYALRWINMKKLTIPLKVARITMKALAHWHYALTGFMLALEVALLAQCLPPCQRCFRFTLDAPFACTIAYLYDRKLLANEGHSRIAFCACYAVCPRPPRLIWFMRAVVDEHLGHTKLPLSVSAPVLQKWLGQSLNIESASFSLIS